jgi:hypothetical protein
VTTQTARREVPATGRSGHGLRAYRAELRTVWRLPSHFGQLAASTTAHRFAPLNTSQCALCFGWRDDYRHLPLDLRGWAL